MNAYDDSIHPVPTWSAHSTPRSLVVAVILAIAPFFAAVALTYPPVAAALLAVAAALAVAPATGRRLVRAVRRSGRHQE
ncbi:MAG: hypothetical protein V5A43_08415 [Haloarculaceae archaeon]